MRRLLLLAFAAALAVYLRDAVIEIWKPALEVLSAIAH